MNLSEGGPNGATVVRPSSSDRYELREDGKTIGYAQYRMSDDGSRIIFTHTEVDQDYSGHGLGGRLARFALEDAKSRGKKVVAECPFIASYVRKHHEYDDILDIAPGSAG